MACSKTNKKYRSKSGKPNAKARKKYGNSKGKFPIFDQKSAMSAIKLRGHASSKKAVLDRASRWAGRCNNTKVKKAVAEARKRDRKR